MDEVDGGSCYEASTDYCKYLSTLSSIESPSRLTRAPNNATKDVQDGRVDSMNMLRTSSFQLQCSKQRVSILPLGDCAGAGRWPLNVGAR